MEMRLRFVLVTCLLLISWTGNASTDDLSATTTVSDIHALLLEVEAHQKQLEKIREDYTYREIIRSEDLDSNGSVKKVETDEYDVFFVNTHPIRRQVRKDGKDLNPDEQKKEQERVNKEVEKAVKTPPGEALNGDTISVRRLLQIIEIKNPRRLNYKDRPTIAFDFVGDPHAKTHGMTEDISKRLSGTVWIDEKDRQVARMEAHIDDNFHLGGGLVASVQKGSSFTFDQALVNHELWLPTGGDIRFSARVLLLKGVRQNIHVQDDQYQKFHADAMQVPGVTLTTPTKP
jgi:hypothetical protein